MRYCRCLGIYLSKYGRLEKKNNLVKKKKKKNNNLVEEEEDSNKILIVPKTKQKAEKIARGNMGGKLYNRLPRPFMIIQVQQDLGASFDAELFHFVTADATGT